jgi:hypothetical protein
VAMPISLTPVEIGTSRPAPRQRTVGHTGVDAMIGGLSFLAVGLVIGVAIAWVLPGFPQLLPSVAARAAPQAEKRPGEPDQPSLVKIDADNAVRAAQLANELPQELFERNKILRDKRPGLRPAPVHHELVRSIRPTASASWLESKRFGAVFTGAATLATFAPFHGWSALAVSLLSVAGYWLIFTDTAD